MKVQLGNMAEDLPKDREFQHPSITIYGPDARKLAGITGNFLDVYRDINFANALGYDGTPNQPSVILYIAFSQGVEDLSLNSPAFLGMGNVSFGNPVYDGHTIASKSKVYGNKPTRKLDRHSVGFISDAYLEPSLGEVGPFVARWTRANIVLKSNPEKEVEYNEERDGNPSKPPSITPLGTYVPQARNLAAIIERANSRGELFADSLEPGTVFEFPYGRTMTFSTPSDTAYGFRNIATVHHDRKTVEDNPQSYYDGYVIQFGLHTLLTASGIAGARRYATTIAELGMDNIKFSFPVMPGTTINDVRAEVVGFDDSHPASSEYATAVTYKITAKGAIPDYLKRERDMRLLPKNGTLAGLFTGLKETDQDINNPQVLSFEYTVLQLRRPKTA